MQEKNEKILEKFLRDVVGTIVGKQSGGISELLKSEKHVNEFLIAKKLNITINQARNLLYKISDYGLVSSIRKKDKKKGWYTYFWKIEVLKALEFLKDIIVKKMDQINSQIKSREVKQFYYCEKCNIEYSEENALLHDFTCPECGSVFVIKDNSKVIKEMKKAVDKMKGELKILDMEIEKEKEKVDKKRVNEIKKISKEKLKNKKKASKARKDLKKKNELAAKKKPLKKKLKKTNLKKGLKKSLKKKGKK